MMRLRDFMRPLLFAGATAAVLVGLAGLTAPSAAGPPWMDQSVPPEQRADLLVAAMSLDQKIEQLHGQPGSIPELPNCGSARRHVPSISELSIPTFRITNGPVGLGGGDCSPQEKATALPVALALAASFDPSLAYSFGNLIGGEARTLGLHELEGPGMNMARVGQGGRNFEYLGEDPVLAGSIAASEIRGIQTNGIIAMAKHYVLNDQEQNRDGGNVIVDDRVLHELYLLPFEMSVKDGGVGSVMCSYNRIGGTYACENMHTLTDVLRSQWGFAGYVQSDFGATHSTALSLNAGEDFEMPSPTWYTPERIKAALGDGSLSLDTIDRALKRRYTQMFRFGIFDRPITRGTIDAAADGATARAIGEQTAVLLKNDGAILPLDGSQVRSIALIGQSTLANSAVSGGGGSSRVSPLYTVTPFQGLENVLASLGSPAQVSLVVVADDNSNLAVATAAARNAEITIIMAGVVTSEGRDRASLSLPNHQDELISAVAAASPRTVVVLKDGDPVLMPWIDQVPAVLEAWNPGEEDGNVVARLLFGIVNPSGKLPVTYPRLASDTPTTTLERYPGMLENGMPTVHYSEGLQMGYRWYQSRNIQPLFPFGFGLSYTTFKFSRLEVRPETTDGSRPIRVRFRVRNTGKRAGAEVPQVYLRLPSSTGEPSIRLVAFQKVWLEPGEKQTIELMIDPSTTSHPLSIWDTGAQRWTVVDGRYTIYVAKSSADIVLSESISVHMRDGDDD